MPGGTPDFAGRGRAPGTRETMGRGGLMTVRRPTALAVLLVLVLAGASVAGTLVIAAASTVAVLGAAAACLVRAGRRRGRMRLAWGGLGLGALAFALGGGSLT